MKQVIRAGLFALALSLLILSAASAQGSVKITVTQIDQTRFPQMDVYVSVTDVNGNPVRNLAPNAFRLEQNGQPINLVSATRAGEQGPVSTVLVIDHSGSMAFSDKMAGAKQAAVTFVSLMRPADKTALVQFDTEIETLQPLTSDKAALTAAIQKIYPRGNTAMYDALAHAGKYFEAVDGRKAIIVVTDGMDNASKLNRAGAVEQAEKAGYSIYTIGLGKQGAGYGSQEGIDESVLKELATASLGNYAYTPDAAQLSALYQQISVLIQNEYKLSFVSPNSLRDGLKRNIVVTAPGASGVQATYNPGGLIPEASQDWSSWAMFFAVLALLVALVFAPAGLRLATARMAPASAGAAATSPQTAAPRPRIKLGEASPAVSQPVRPARIKIGKASRTSTNETNPALPWDEDEPKH